MPTKNKDEIKENARRLLNSGADREKVKKYISLALGEISDIPEQSLAEKSSKFLQEPSSFMPLVALAKPAIETTPKLAQIGMSVKDPEDILPIVGGAGGAAIGSIATLPSGGGLPFGATIGAGIGGQVGETARQYVRAIKGKSIPETIPEALAKTGIEGAKQSALELTGSAVAKSAIKTFEAIGAKRLVGNSFNKFRSYLDNIFKAKTDTPIATIKTSEFKQIKDKVASNLTDTGEFIDNLFSERGISYKPSKEALRKKLLDEADLSTPELAQIAQQIADEKSGKLTSNLATPDISKFKKMADILDDLSKNDLTYGDLYKIRQTSGDFAEFGKSDRSPIEKIYGSIYNNLNKDLERTAKEGNFFEIHKKLNQEGRKYYQRQFLNDIFEGSRNFLPTGEEVNYSILKNKLNSYTDNQLKSIFGDEFKNIQILRDLTNTYAKRIKQENFVHPYVSMRGAGVSAHPSTLLGRFKTRGDVQTIGNRYGMDIPLPELKLSRK